MHPAPSIIFFTVFSGMGFGMLTFLGLGKPDVSGFTGFVFFFIAYAMAVGGLLSSTFHLGNPQRAIKAFSQWRSWGDFPEHPLGSSGHDWGHPQPSDRLLHVDDLCADEDRTALEQLDRARAVHGLCSDRGRVHDRSGQDRHVRVSDFGRVASCAPHTAKNYLMTEMVHQVGRKHAQKLRIAGLVMVSLLPFLILFLTGFSHFKALLVVVLHLLGALTTRWLFFAEAEHTVGLYYGKR